MLRIASQSNFDRVPVVDGPPQFWQERQRRFEPLLRVSTTCTERGFACPSGDTSTKLNAIRAASALRNPDSRAYYDRKIAQGKLHNQALLGLARSRSDVL